MIASYHLYQVLPPPHDICPLLFIKEIKDVVKRGEARDVATEVFILDLSLSNIEQSWSRLQLIHCHTK